MTENSKYETGRLLTDAAQMAGRYIATIAQLRETVARLTREQKEDRDHIRMQGDTIVRLTQELADERQAVSILLRRIDSERPYPE
jgi:predicted RNase H-like nuclease (RuvC/YqgF family)